MMKKIMFIILLIIAIVSTIALIVYNIANQKIEYTLDKDVVLQGKELQIENFNGIAKIEGGKGDFTTSSFTTTKDLAAVKIIVGDKELKVEDFSDEVNPPGIIIRVTDVNNKFLYNVVNNTILEKGEYKLSISSSKHFKIEVKLN